MDKRKSVLALLLCLVLCLSLFPATVFAEEKEDAEPAAEEIEKTTDAAADTDAGAEEIVEEADAVLETGEVLPAEESEDIVEEEDVLSAEEYTDHETYVGDPGLPKLAMPSNLHWDSDYPGVFSLTVNQPFQDEMCCGLYRIGENEPVYETHYRLTGYPLDQGKWRTDLFTQYLEKQGSGDYYVACYAEGDGISYSDSDKVQSEVWHYEKPSAYLPKMAKPVLNGITATFVFPEDVEYATGINMEIRFARTADEEPYRVGATWRPIYYEDVQSAVTSWDIYDNCLERNGPGFYSVRFQLLSRDITVFNNGEWSEWSEPSNVTEIQTSVRNQLQTIAANSYDKSADEIRSEVQNLDRDDLKTAMETDRGYGGVIGTMKELENRLGGTEVIVKSEVAGSFNVGDIDVTGAQLNTPKTAGKPISFVLDKPKYNDVVPAMYNSSVAVRFSMDLENADTSRELDVPVKVVLPIPAGINPTFLAILHYHVNGGQPTAIVPYVFQDGSKYFAAFVLTDFSDFIFTEPIENTLSFQTTLNLADYTGINVYIELPEGEDASAYTVESTYKSYRQTSNKYENLSSLPKGSGERAGMYKFDALHAASTEMSDVVTVKLLKSGEVVKTEQYSVRSIAEEKLAAGGLDAETETLYRALLQYGRYGQLTFGNKTDDLPGTEGAPALAPIPATYAPKNDPTNFGAYVTKFERKLDLNAATSMNLYISFANGYSMNSFNISVLDKDGKTYPTSKWSVTDMGNNRVRVKIEGVLSPQLARNFSIQVTLKSDTTKTATWNSSVLTCAYVYDRTLSGDAKSLMQALYQYWLASAARFPQYR